MYNGLQRSMIDEGIKGSGLWVSNSSNLLAELDLTEVGTMVLCESMCKSRKLSIRLLFDLWKNEQRTKLCNNLSNIANETYVDKLSLNKSLVKSIMIFANPAENAWRIPLLKDLPLIRSNQNVLEGFNYDEIAVIIDDICKH